MQDKGFTLMEVVVVAVILAVLASIAFVGVGQASRFSQRRNCETDVRSVMAGMASYVNDWPGTPTPSPTPASIPAGSTPSTSAAPVITISPYTTASPTLTPPWVPENIVPNYLARLSTPAVSGTPNSGQPYTIGGVMTGVSIDSWNYYVTVAKAPTPATTVTIVPAPTAPVNAPTYAISDVARACSEVLP